MGNVSLVNAFIDTFLIQDLAILPNAENHKHR